jgi:CRP-like cAMP-binding protein
MRDVRDISLFDGVRRRERHIIDRVGTAVDVRAGTRLTRQGRTNRQFSVVLDGEVRVTRDERELCRLGPGQWFGELALLTDRVATATVDAVADARLLTMDGREFSWLCHEVEVVGARIRDTALHRLRADLVG